MHTHVPVATLNLLSVTTVLYIKPHSYSMAAFYHITVHQLTVEQLLQMTLCIDKIKSKHLVQCI